MRMQRRAQESHGCSLCVQAHQDTHSPSDGRPTIHHRHLIQTTVRLASYPEPIATKSSSQMKYIFKCILRRIARMRREWGEGSGGGSWGGRGREVAAIASVVLMIDSTIIAEHILERTPFHRQHLLPIRLAHSIGGLARRLGRLQIFLRQVCDVWGRGMATCRYVEAWE